MTTRVFADQPLAEGAELTLDQDAAHHLGRVLRLKPGDNIEVFDGRGNAHGATIQSIAKQAVRVTLDMRCTTDNESPLKLTLVQAVSKGQRMDFAIQKAVELGVSEIVPVLSERSVVRLDAARSESKHGHWLGVVKHACAQSGRNRLPTLGAIQTLADWMASWDSARTGFVLDPRANTPVAQIDALDACALMVGPEGGFSDREIAMLGDNGLHGLRVGPRILRTETAAVVGLTVLQARFGDLAG